jgi:hypothetical protein
MNSSQSSSFTLLKFNYLIFHKLRKNFNRMIKPGISATVKLVIQEGKLMFIAEGHGGIYRAYYILHDEKKILFEIIKGQKARSIDISDKTYATILETMKKYCEKTKKPLYLLLSADTMYLTLNQKLRVAQEPIYTSFASKEATKIPEFDEQESMLNLSPHHVKYLAKAKSKVVHLLFNHEILKLQPNESSAYIQSSTKELINRQALNTAMSIYNDTLRCEPVDDINKLICYIIMGENVINFFKTEVAQKKNKEKSPLDIAYRNLNFNVAFVKDVHDKVRSKTTIYKIKRDNKGFMERLYYQMKDIYEAILCPKDFVIKIKDKQRLLGNSDRFEVNFLDEARGNSVIIDNNVNQLPFFSNANEHKRLLSENHRSESINNISIQERPDNSIQQLNNSSIVNESAESRSEYTFNNNIRVISVLNNNNNNVNNLSGVSNERNNNINNINRMSNERNNNINNLSRLSNESKNNTSISIELNMKHPLDECVFPKYDPDQYKDQNLNKSNDIRSIFASNNFVNNQPPQIPNNSFNLFKPGEQVSGLLNHSYINAQPSSVSGIKPIPLGLNTSSNNINNNIDNNNPFTNLVFDNSIFGPSVEKKSNQSISFNAGRNNKENNVYSHMSVGNSQVNSQSASIPNIASMERAVKIEESKKLSGDQNRNKGKKAKKN